MATCQELGVVSQDRTVEEARLNLVEAVEGFLLLGGTFFSADELPGRDLTQIPHPLATDTAERLVGVDCDVRLIHLNHSNPLHRDGLERAWLAERGILTGSTEDRWTL